MHFIYRLSIKKMFQCININFIKSSCVLYTRFYCISCYLQSVSEFLNEAINPPDKLAHASLTISILSSTTQLGCSAFNYTLKKKQLKQLIIDQFQTVFTGMVNTTTGVQPFPFKLFYLFFK